MAINISANCESLLAIASLASTLSHRRVHANNDDTLQRIPALDRRPQKALIVLWRIFGGNIANANKIVRA